MERDLAVDTGDTDLPCVRMQVCVNRPGNHHVEMNKSDIQKGMWLFDNSNRHMFFVRTSHVNSRGLGIVTIFDGRPDLYDALPARANSNVASEIVDGKDWIRADDKISFLLERLFDHCFLLY